MAAIEDMFTWLMTSGAYDALLPFFLIFTLVFAFLQKVKMFEGGDSPAGSSRKFNIAVAFILALIVVVPHVTNSYPPGADVVQIMLDAMPNVLLWVVAIFALWLLLAALGLPVTFGESNAGMQGFLTIVSVTVVAIIFGYAAGWFPPNWDLTRFLDGIDAGILQIILIIGIVIAVLAWLLSDDSGGGNNDNNNRTRRNYVGDGLNALGESLGNKKNPR